MLKFIILKSPIINTKRKKKEKKRIKNAINFSQGCNAESLNREKNHFKGLFIRLVALMPILKKA